MIAPIYARWLVAALCTLLSGCGPFFDEIADRRATYAEAGEGPIVVAVVNDWPDGSYLDGIRLAAEQINSSQEGPLGRPIELLVRPGSEDFHEVYPTIRSIAANPTVTAILGHRSSAVAVPASITYDKARVLFMPPFATSERLTLHGFDFVLRMLSDNKSMAAQIASLAGLFGYERIAVLHGRSDSSRSVAFLFEDAARRFDIDIAFRASFFAASENYRELIGQLKGIDFDAVFLSTEVRSGARMLRQLRELGINKPVLGTDSLGAGPLIELAGDAGSRTIVPTVFSPETTNNSKRRFIQDYRDTYAREPDQAAAQGYDSLRVLATMIERSGTTEPRALATTAHFTAPIAGITGIYAYDPEGNIYGKSYRFKVLRFGRWWSLPGVTIPYLMARYQVLTRDADNTQTPQPQQTDAPDPSGQGAASPPDPAQAPTADSANPDQPDPQAAAAPATMDDEESTPGNGADLATLTRGYGGAIERDQAWLALAHEILGFDRLGLVISPALSHDVALVGLARSVARIRGFEVETCELPTQASESEGATLDEHGQQPDSTAKGPDADANWRVALEKAALRCYSRLARTVDSLFVVTDTSLTPSYLRRLNRTLLHFGVSTFALEETIEHDYGLTLALVSSGLDLRDPNLALRFNGLLHGMRVHELNQKISRLPSVSVDLEAARSLGLFTDPRELTLISGVLDSSLPAPALSLAEETN